MALVKYGGGIVSMSGSIAGNTFARNHYGNYIRARTKPVNPNTALQQAVRSSLALMAYRWAQILDKDQRDDWNEYGSKVAMKNKLSETIYMTGFNHYIRSNSIRQQNGVALIDDGPKIFLLPTHDETFAITTTEASQEFEITFNDALAWSLETGAYMFLYQGSPQNAQRNYFNGPWRKLGLIAGVDSTGASSPDTKAVIYPVAQFQHQWVYARIARLDGRLSEPFRADTFCGG